MRSCPARVPPSPSFQCSRSSFHFEAQQLGFQYKNDRLACLETITLPCFLHKITRRRRTMGVEKSMKEIAAGVEVASTFPGPIPQEPARSVLSAARGGSRPASELWANGKRALKACVRAALAENYPPAAHNGCRLTSASPALASPARLPRPAKNRTPSPPPPLPPKMPTFRSLLRPV